ncbi:hypothetical protein TNCV_233511 [Trichonephila clavipes]|nr:hypothetical protein TNCV_233511 [Trichonephila clavipes]
MVLTSTEIYAGAKELICRTWVVPPVHPCPFCNLWGLPVRRLLHSPAVLSLCTDLWTHGFGLVLLDHRWELVPPPRDYEKIKALIVESLGHQSLPPTDLGRVDEEMDSPGGRPLQWYQNMTRQKQHRP